MNANYIVNLYKFVWVLFQFENPISKNVSIAANFTRTRAVNSDQLSQHCECVCVCVFCALSYIFCVANSVGIRRKSWLVANWYAKPCSRCAPFCPWTVRRHADAC